MTTTTCPPWCGRDSEHDLHTRHAGWARDVSVSLVLDDAWDSPRLLVMHYRTQEDQSAVLLPLNEADSMAALMTHLGHGDIARLVRDAAEVK